MHNANVQHAKQFVAASSYDTLITQERLHHATAAANAN